MAGGDTIGKQNTIGKLKGVRKPKRHLDGASFFPVDPALLQDEIKNVIREYVLPGHLPDQPFLDAGEPVISLGACFARHLRAHLQGMGLLADNFFIPGNLTTSPGMLAFISWSVTGDTAGVGYDYETAGKVSGASPAELRDQFKRAGAFVLTFGLSELWEDSETGQVFWRGVPQDRFLEGRHRFRVTTVEENLENIEKIVALIRQVNPSAPIVLTLSPLPLKATFRPFSCLTADSVSKSILRVALDLALAKHPENVYYWPSFEAVRWLSGHRSELTFAGQDSRHVDDALVSAIAELFVEAYYLPEVRTAGASR